MKCLSMDVDLSFSTSPEMASCRKISQTLKTLTRRSIRHPIQSSKLPQCFSTFYFAECLTKPCFFIRTYVFIILRRRHISAVFVLILNIILIQNHDFVWAIYVSLIVGWDVESLHACLHRPGGDLRLQLKWSHELPIPGNEKVEQLQLKD